MTYGRAFVRATLVAALLGATGAAMGEARSVSPPAPLGGARQPTALQRYIEHANAAIVAAEQADGNAAPAAAAALSKLIDDPLFTMLSTPSQRLLVSAKGSLTWQQGDPKGARDLFRQATQIDGDDPDDWYRLAILELELGDRARSARYMTALVNRWPHLANNIKRHVIGDYVQHGGPEASWRTALLQALFDAGWTDSDRGVDSAWQELALAHVAGGNLAEAAKAIARIGDPLVIIQVRSDKRFDPLADAVEALPAARVAAERRVEELRRLVADSPKRIDLASSLGTALLVAGRHQETVEVADAVLAAIASGDPTSFEHLDYKPWVMNNRAIALRRLGRIEEALADIERASHMAEDDSPNVSQVLNLATLYCAVGRPEDALRTIDRAGRMSGYGRMVLTAVQHCAAIESGNRVTARVAMDYLLAHRSDSDAIVMEAFLREGRLDEAAQLLIGQLEDPDERNDALEFAQQFRTGPELPGTRATLANRRALLAREDVKAAVDRVGRMGEHDVFSITGMD